MFKNQIIELAKFITFSMVAVLILILIVAIPNFFLFLWRDCVWEWRPRVFDGACYSEVWGKAFIKGIETVGGESVSEE